MGPLQAECQRASQQASQQAMELLRRGQGPGALLQAKCAIDSDRTSPNAWLTFAKCLRAIGQLDACYSCAIKGRQLALDGGFHQRSAALALAAEAMSALELICAGAGSKAEREKDHRQRDEMCADRLKSAPVRVFALSDLHVDQGCNMDYIEEMHSQAFQNDVLIVAGDVADTFNATVHALKVLKSKFMRVFYVAGNHCLWNRNETQQANPDSVAKLLAIMDACDKMGVDVNAGQISPQCLVVPLLSWYHYSFDRVPVPGKYRFDSFCQFPVDEVEGVWQLFLAFNRPSLSWARRQLKAVQDNAASHRDGGNSRQHGSSNRSNCSSSNGQSAAEEMSMRTAGMHISQGSKEHDAAAAGAASTHSEQQVITFSHFLPRKELPYSSLIPELGKAMGCLQLEDQLDLLKSTIHVYGHSHIPNDTRLPVRGSNHTRRYVHNPLDGVAKPVLVCLWNSSGARCGAVDFCGGQPVL